MGDRGLYLMINYLRAFETMKTKKERVQYMILVCTPLIIQYLLINSWNSFSVNS